MSRARSREFWEGQTSSGSRHNSDIFWAEKAKEHAALFTPEERNQPTVDLGCGAGELTLRLLDHCQVVEAVDFSKSMLDQARQRLEGKGVSLIHCDFEAYVQRSKMPIWTAAGSVNQYVDLAGLRLLLRSFADNPSARSLLLFDTIDPDRNRLRLRGQANYLAAKQHSKARFIKYAVKDLVRALVGKANELCVKLEEMGYGIQTRFWLDETKALGLECQLVSSRYYEYRYHVLTRKG